MVQKIEDSYFEKEEFWYEFCLEISVLFGPILAKKVLHKKRCILLSHAVFLDMSKVFDKVWQPGILFKMTRNMEEIRR